MESTEHSEQEEFLKKYWELQEKFSLPDFTKLSEDFDVDKLFEKETNFLLRETRRVISEKISNYLHLFELLMNPSAPPMFIFSVLKTLTEEDKKLIKEIYKSLAKIQIKSMKLDTLYSEKSEAEFITDSFKIWQKLKSEINSLIEKFDEGFDMETNGRERGYFG